MDQDSTSLTVAITGTSGFQHRPEFTKVNHGIEISISEGHLVTWVSGFGFYRGISPALPMLNR